MRKLILTCIAALMAFVSGFIPQSAVAQNVLTSPTTSQTVTQPAGTTFGIQAGSAISYQFTDPGIAEPFSTTSGGAVFSGKITAANGNPSADEYHLITPTFTCAQPGWSIGNNGTSLGGWSICDLMSSTFIAAQRGIAHSESVTMNKFAQGDTAVNYSYLDAFGGVTATSDEGVTQTALHSNQVGYMKGPITSGGTAGSNLIQATVSCNGYCGTLDERYFPDGGMLLDYTRGGAKTATLIDRKFSSALNNDYYDVSGGSFEPSTAWGTMSNCTGNSSPAQVYTSTTCDITLGTSPASPGDFLAGQDMFLSGPEQEEVAVTAAPKSIGGVQSVTFNTRYAWDNGSNPLAMQGGPGGQAIVLSSQTGSWPVAYAVVGATSPTTLFYSNCVIGHCNIGGGSPNPITSTVLNAGRTLTRSGNVVTLTGGGNDGLLYNLTVGSSITVSGFTPSDLNGTFTVASNTFDINNIAVTWAQTGPNETNSVAGSVIPTPPQVTFYPMAFITGTNNGTTGGANLATNTVPFVNGDTVVGAPTSEYQQAGLQIYVGQTTPSDGSVISRAFSIDDQGPSPAPFEMEVINESSQQAAALLHARGAYENYFQFENRPAYNGCILCVSPSEAPATNPKKYTIFEDGANTLTFDPNTATMDWSGGILNGPAGNFTVGAGTHGNLEAANGVFSNTVSAGGTVSAGTVSAGAVNAGAVSVATAGSAAISLSTTGNAQSSAMQFNAPGVNPESLGCWGTGNGAGLPGACGLYDSTNGHFIWNTNTSDDLFGNTPVTNVSAGIGAAWSIKHTGDASFSSSVTSPSYYGRSTAPAGSCSTNGAWVFSQDGHATFCASGTWVTKI